MKIKPLFGIDKLLFGMKPADVLAIYGMPSKEYRDEDDNKIFLYNAQKWRLTFYADEEYRLGYIIVSNSETTLFEKPILNRKFEDVKKDLELHKIKSWEAEDFEPAVNYLNEDNWLICVVEFEDVVKVEIGALIVDDEFVWRF